MWGAQSAMILAHHRGLLTGCKVLERDGDRVRVKVQDEKRPKWIDLATGKHAIFEDPEQAIAWVESHEKESD
jgi:hypothetical protein